MALEHCGGAGSCFEFHSANYGVTTTPRREWEIVAEGRAADAADLRHGRRIPRIGELLALESAAAAGLREVEVMALVLYTGPMYMVYNAVLRRHPPELYGAFAGGESPFATTLHVLVSAVQKLARSAKVPDGLPLYRGLGGRTELPAHFGRCDGHGCRGLAEWGFMSTTSSLEVALRYSGVEEGRPRPAVLVMRAGAVDRGACIGEFSQYPGEREYLWVPCSFLQPDGPACARALPGGAVAVVPVRVNANLKAATVEEILEGKRSTHLASFRHLLEELRQRLRATCEREDAAGRLRREQAGAAAASARGGRLRSLSTFGKSVGPGELGREPSGGGVPEAVSGLLDRILEECRAVYARHAATPAERYPDNHTFRTLVMEMLEAEAMAASKLHLWLFDEARPLAFARDEYPLRRAHRSRLAFLHRTLPAGPPAARREAAAALCRLKGLVRESVGEANEMGETRILWAAAEGLGRRDLHLLIDAGADPNETDPEGRTPVFVAASYGYAGAIRALAERGADARARADGVGPVWVAALNGAADCIAALGELRADVDAGDRDGVTPALIAAEKGHAACLRELRRLGADLGRADGRGRTPAEAARRLPRGAAREECLRELGAVAAAEPVADLEPGPARQDNSGDGGGGAGPAGSAGWGLHDCEPGAP